MTEIAIAFFFNFPASSRLWTRENLGQNLLSLMLRKMESNQTELVIKTAPLTVEWIISVSL